MPGASGTKPIAATVRIRREHNKSPRIEGGWLLVRIEPESGNIVCERDGRRAVSGRREFESLNFPGSDEIWAVVSNEHDADLTKAEQAWVKLDMDAMLRALLKHASKLDPAFQGVQTVSDMAEKIGEIEAVCKKSMDLLRLEVKRAQGEYERCPTNTTLDRDKKENMLDCIRDRENRYAALAYRAETQLPIWQKLVSAIKNINAIDKN